MSFKKFLVVFLVLATLVMGCSTVYAANLKAVGASNLVDPWSSDDNITGETVPTEQQYIAYKASLSAYDLQNIVAKEELASKYANKIGTKSGTKISIPGTFTMYQQETDTYCIPATIKSILMYINGSSPSQSTIAGTTGTDPTKIAGYLNARQNTCYYVYRAKNDLTQNGMCSYLYTTIASTKVPASMGISGTTTSNWYYVTNGHSLVVNAIYDDYSYIQFGDPLGDRVAGCPYYYLKSSSLCYSVCTRIVW